MILSIIDCDKTTMYVNLVILCVILTTQKRGRIEISLIGLTLLHFYDCPKLCHGLFVFNDLRGFGLNLTITDEPFFS